MKNIVISLITTLFAIQSYSQTLEGAYIAQDDQNIHLILITDGYISHTLYNNETYTNTRGGTYSFHNGQLFVNCEFDNQYPENVGQTFQFTTQSSNEGLNIDGVYLQKQPHIPQNLDGLWRISGRMNNGALQAIQRGDRKTIKILIDGYFQWIAINPKEKGFYGTGGGKYTFDKDKYTENVLFFSRDNSRVGAVLTFEGKIENDNWHHSGKSSKGDPIHEIWSKEKK